VAPSPSWAAAQDGRPVPKPLPALGGTRGDVRDQVRAPTHLLTPEGLALVLGSSGSDPEEFN
jgi:hypothetical protein